MKLRAVGGENVRVVKLSEVVEINPRRPTLDFSEAELTTFVPMEAVDEVAGEIVRSVRRPFSQVKKGYTVFAENDVLFAKITPCMQNGKHALARGLIKKTGFGSTEFHVIRAGKEIEPEWIHFFLRRKETLDAAIKSFTGSVGQQRVPAFFLENLEIPLPPIEHQRRIAAHLKLQLAAVEEARQAAQKQTGEIKQLFQALLKDAFEGLQDAEWVKIGDLAKTTSGSTPARGLKEYWEPPKHPWVKTGEVVFSPIYKTDEAVSERALAECSISLLPVGTVLVAMYGQGKTRGQSAVLKVPATTNQACFAILPNERFDSEYIQFWLRHSYQALRELSDSRGGNQANLNGELLNSFDIPLLPIHRQQSIARQLQKQLTAVEEAEAASAAQLADIGRLPARLLAQAFNPHAGDMP